MGTQSITRFYKTFRPRNGQTMKVFLGAFHREYDGQVSGHGRQLKRLLEGRKIIHGSHKQASEQNFDGIDCMGAWIISKMKQSIGDIYLTVEEDYQRYNYDLWNEGKEIFIRIVIGNNKDNVFYEGRLDGMPE